MATKKAATKPDGTAFTSSSVDKILPALSAVQAGVQLTERDQTGLTEDDKEYAYSSLGVVWAAVQTLQGENDLTLIQRFRDGNLHTVLYHTSGQWIDFGDYPLGDVDNHNDLGAAISFARRYTLQVVYCIVAEAEDDSAAGAKKISRQKVADGAADILNPPSHFETEEARTQWINDQWESLRTAPDMDELRKRFDGMSETINAALASGNAEDKVAVAGVRSRFDNRRDALSTPRAGRRTVDSAAASKK